MNSGAPDFGYETSENDVQTIHGLRAQIAGAQIRNCGFWHEANISAHQTPGSVFTLYRSDNALPVLSQYLCADRGQVASCAHRNENYRPDVFTTEVSQLCAMGILDSSWENVSQSLCQRLTELDEQAAANRFAPDAQNREPWQKLAEPIIADVTLLQQHLLEQIDHWLTANSSGSEWHVPTCPLTIVASERIITPSTLQKPTLRRRPLSAMVQAAHERIAAVLHAIKIV